jgi:hypothetical protein
VLLLLRVPRLPDLEGEPLGLLCENASCLKEKRLEQALGIG